MFSRRKFLGLTATAGLSPLVLQGCNVLDVGDSSVADSAWQVLRQTLKANGDTGRLVLPDAPTFKALSLPHNTFFAHIRPQGVVRCSSAEDVATAVRWAVDHGLMPVPRSAAGHSYAGYCTTTDLSLEMAPMKSVEFLDDDVVKIQAGARLGDVLNTLAEQGLFLPIGRCMTVGVAGLTLGGGFGFNSRRYGLTCDSLLETEVVTADGQILTCNESSHSDLFWALRGGNGGTFGVNTSFTFKAQRATEDFSVFRLRWNIKANNADKVLAVWSALQAMATNASRDLSLRIGVDYSPEAGFTLEGLGQYHGDPAPLMSVLAPAIDQAPDYQFVETLDFASAERYLGALGAANAFYTKSAFIENDLAKDVMVNLIDWLKAMPVNGKSGSITMFRWGGAIEDVAPAATAFVHRKAQYVLEGTACWRPGDSKELIDESIDWVHRGFVEHFDKVSNGHAFQNFIDRRQANWQQAYYGENFTRLTQVKKQYDPKNIFNNAQSIPPAV